MNKDLKVGDFVILSENTEWDIGDDNPLQTVGKVYAVGYGGVEVTWGEKGWNWYNLEHSDLIKIHGVYNVGDKYIETSLRILVITDRKDRPYRHVRTDQGVLIHYVNPEGKPQHLNICGMQVDTIVIEGKPKLSEYQILYACTRIRGTNNNDNYFSKLFGLKKKRWEEQQDLS